MNKKIILVILIFLVSFLLFSSESYAYDYSKSCTSESVEQLAKLIFWESGSNYSNDPEEAFFMQITVGAVAINNASRNAKTNGMASKSEWDKKIYYLIDTCYSNHSKYRDTNINNLITNKNTRGKLLYISSLILSGKYTFPTNMTGQAAVYLAKNYCVNANNGGWYTFYNTGGENTMICYEVGLSDTNTDQFGNEISNTSVDYYRSLAKSYMKSDYSNYTSSNVCSMASSSTTKPSITQKPSTTTNDTIVDACTNPDILRVIYFAKLILNIVKIVIPLGLIIMGMIDFSKSVVTSDVGSQNKNMKLFIKRVIYAVLIFAVPWIVETLMVTLGDLTEGVNFTDCLQNATEEKIAELEESK